MEIISASSAKLNASDLPLFAAAERASIRALPLAARKLARRLTLPPATARVIAELAGFEKEAGR